MPILSDPGFNFQGWDISVDTQGYESTVKDGKLYIPANAYGEIKLSAVWEGKQYTIYLYMKGSDTHYATTSYYTSKDNQTVTPTLPEESTQPGYITIGWQFINRTDGRDGNNSGIKANDCRVLIITAEDYGEFHLMTTETKHEPECT